MKTVADLILALQALDPAMPFTVSVGTPKDTWASDLGEVSLDVNTNSAYTEDGGPCAVLRGWMSSDQGEDEDED